ncbi:MAG: Dam family site-specific DNA-(adenine-N6)-methyltransferase [Malacoplasma sp.]
MNKVLAIEPYVKWVGGKRQLLNVIVDMLPDKFEKYIEPFLGGGALFFYLQPKISIVNDINWELINSLKTIRANYIALIECLDLYNSKHDETFFYQLRKEYSNLDDINMAARFIYLNKTCFNGIYRVNKKNEFNVPFNNKVKVNLYSKENIKNISEFLNTSKVSIHNDDFSKILLMAKKNDFVFVDPPYDTNDNQFTSYTKTGFGKEEQNKLADLLDKLNDNGVKWMMTNSPTDFICKRYNKYNQKIIDVNRMINSDASKRINGAKEIIITNYER